MPKTGSVFIDAFAQFMVFFPLLPVILIVWKKAWHADTLNFLMIFCLLYFLQQFTTLILTVPPLYRQASNNIFLLLETLVYIQLFKNLFSGWARDALRIFTVCFFTSLITFYLLKGTGEHGRVLGMIQFLFIIALVAYCLPGMIRRDELQILQSPVFWIAVGTLFYYCIVVLMELADPIYGRWKTNPFSSEKLIMVTIADLIRFILYTVAVLVQRPARHR